MRREMKSICNRKNLIPHHSQGKTVENARSHSMQCAPLGCTRIRELLEPALRAFCFLLSLLHPSFPLPFIRNFTSVAVLDTPWERRLPGPGQLCATQRCALLGELERKPGASAVACTLPAFCRATGAASLYKLSGIHEKEETLK